MASKRSKTKRSKISSADRISDLPDLLLITILSFLPFHSAVSTSLLSKRWRPLCMSLTNLRFNDSNGKKSGPPFISRVDKFFIYLVSIRMYTFDFIRLERHSGNVSDANHTESLVAIKGMESDRITLHATTSYASILEKELCDLPNVMSKISSVTPSSLLSAVSQQRSARSSDSPAEI
ncbi:hypothetical protein POM88_028831 [Heracleum sosnowskyi]|uniref:F-box domain-containing protein n=1 Tax=Heracleum sosnowskyi TaxID=360622 RepID=A0AAD8HTM7_9APIA|nr:hypothetical protein POM88_028831 [Heracleum sosnowskyi]